MASGLVAGGVGGGTVLLPWLRQRVFVDGRLRSDVHCLDVSYGHGATGSVGSFEVPSRDWDGNKQDFRGRRVRVDVFYEGGPVETVFVGYFTRPEGSTDGRVVTIGALSMLGLSDGVFVGEGVLDGDLVARYPVRAFGPDGEQETGWNVLAVLRDLFGSSVVEWRGGGGTLPSSWRAVMRLGNTSVLNSVFSQVPLGDLEWRQVSLRDALGELMGLVGNVSFRERFRGDLTYLDFFELGFVNGGVRSVRVAKAGESTAGTNALDVAHEEAAEDSRSRVVALGGRRRTVVSIRSDAEEHGLVRDWDEDLEGVILENPEAGKRGSQDDGGQMRPEFSEELSEVFRNYRLPELLRGLLIDEQNAVELSDGSTLPVQVWKLAADLSWNEGEGKWEAAETAVPVLLEGAQLDLPNRRIVLKEPAINLVESSDAGGDVYEEAVVGVTLTVAGERLRWDTGLKGGGVEFTGLGALADVVANDSFGFRRLGNEIYPETLLLIPGQEWVLYAEPTVLQDDEVALRRFAEGALRERNRPRVTYNVTTPFWSPVFRLGDAIRITEGQRDADRGINQVLSLSANFEHDHSVTFSTDNSLPLISQEVLGG